MVWKIAAIVSTSTCWYTCMCLSQPDGRRETALCGSQPACVQSLLFVYNMHQRTLNNLPFISYFILNSLKPGNISPSWWWTMDSPPQLRWGHHGLPLHQRCMRHWSVSALAQMMACCLVGTRPSSESTRVYCYLESWSDFVVIYLIYHCVINYVF